MPTYDYRCETHGEYDEIVSIKEYTGKDPCPKCGVVGSRIISSKIHFIGASVESPEYNPGLGCVVKNKKDREEICKQRGLVEIGNEKKSALKADADSIKKHNQKKNTLSDSDIKHLAETIK